MLGLEGRRVRGGHQSRPKASKASPTRPATTAQPAIIAMNATNGASFILFAGPGSVRKISMRSRRSPGNNAFVLAVLIAVSLVSGCEPQAQKKRSKKGVSNHLVAGLGDLVGSVRLAGSVLPVATRVQNATDPEVCGPIQATAWP